MRKLTVTLSGSVERTGGYGGVILYPLLGIRHASAMWRTWLTRMLRQRKNKQLVWVSDERERERERAGEREGEGEGGGGEGAISTDW